MQDVLRQSRHSPIKAPMFDDPGQLPALILAYIGDAVFSLHARTTMLSAESSHVRVLHTVLARMASAPFQAKALRELEASLTEQEQAVVRRGRNAKSRVPRNASIAEYHSSTALEAPHGLFVSFRARGTAAADSGADHGMYVPRDDCWRRRRIYR